PEGEQQDDPEGDQPPAGGRFGVQRAPRAPRSAAYGDEKHRQTDERPEKDNGDHHRGEKISPAAQGGAEAPRIRSRRARLGDAGGAAHAVAGGVRPSDFAPFYGPLNPRLNTG